MILPASYQSGLAPRDGSPLYPELWRGCVGAWAPCLGPTGLTLRDWSGFGNHGTLTSGAQFGIRSGRNAVLLDGTDDYNEINNTGTRIASNDNHAISIWFSVSSFANSPVLYSWYESATNDLGFLEFNATGTQIFWGVRRTLSGQTSFRTYTGVNIGTGLNHLLMQKTGSGDAGNLYLNGLLLSSFSGVLYSTPSQLSTLWLGKYVTGGFATSGSVYDCAIFNRNVERHVGLLSRRPGIAYELAPRRRSSVQVTASFNRRRRLLVGAGS